jgi:hypothetical protein
MVDDSIDRVLRTWRHYIDNKVEPEDLINTRDWLAYRHACGEELASEEAAVLSSLNRLFNVFLSDNTPLPDDVKRAMTSVLSVSSEDEQIGERTVSERDLQRRYYETLEGEQSKEDTRRALAEAAALLKHEDG